MTKKKINIKSVTSDVHPGDVNITYKNVRIAGLSESTTAVLETEDTICEDDIEVEYTKNAPAGNIVNIINNSANSPKIQGAALIASNGLFCNNAAAVTIPPGISKLFSYNVVAAQSGSYDITFIIKSEDDLYTITVNNGDPLTWDGRGSYSFVEQSNNLITGQTYNVVITDKG
jgi:hypothetical protein